METARGATDAVCIVVMSRSCLLENGVMITLTAGIFHQGAFTILMLYRAVISEVMRE
jgi:hypothetical protein